ncbi:Oligopeptide transport ATP-binding protein OppF [compost metagenome]
MSALDVSIQAQIINLFSKLQETKGLTYLFISHDLSVVEHLCSTIGVMYLGSMVETASRDELFRNPLHPYTRALLSAVPIPVPKLKRERIVLKGDIPSPANPPSGCKFHTRCPYVKEICKYRDPEFREVGSQHHVACHLV